MNENRSTVFITRIVMVTGTIGGMLAGLAYGDFISSYWWGGPIAGAGSSYFLAKVYLRMLENAVRRGNRYVTWRIGVLPGIIMGVICTTITHGALLFFGYSYELSLEDNIGACTVLLVIGEAVGACTGFLVGGFCASRYIASAQDVSNEVS